MGSWNGTCAVTRLPIFSGDPVVLIPIVERPSYDGGMLVHSTDAWMPFSLPIRGTYNDYGSIEPVEDWHTADLIEHLNKVVDFTTGDDGDIRMWQHEEYDEVAKKYVLKVDESRTILPVTIGPDVFRYICGSTRPHPWKPWENKENRLFLNFIMIHESIYDWMVEQKIEGWSSKGPQKYGKDRVISDGQQIVAAYKKACDERNNAVKDSDNETKKILASIYSLKNYADLQRANGNYFSFYQGEGMTGARDFTRFFDLIETEVQAGKPVDYIIERLAEFQMFFYNFDLMRMTFHPQAGNGSQNAELKLMRKLTTETGKMITRLQKRWDE